MPGQFRAKGPGIVGGRGDPAFQRRAVQPRRLHEDHVLHRPPGEVHLPDMVKFQCTLGGLVADTDHQFATNNASEHVPSQEEGKAAEHLALGQFGVGGHDLAGAGGEVLVVGHQASSRLGRHSIVAYLGPMARGGTYTQVRRCRAAGTIRWGSDADWASVRWLPWSATTGAAFTCPWRHLAPRDRRSRGSG